MLNLLIMMNALTFPILKRLTDGQFHSGEAIARHFNVSRATVWNAIQDAETAGVQVFSVRGRGYKLAQAVTLLEEQAILQTLNQKNTGENTPTFSLEVHDHLASTNSYLMQKVAHGQAHASCVVANLQTQGRGRRGRTWQASLGASLTFSVLWRFQCGAADLSGLSLAVGVALIRVLHEFGVTQAKLKWPNDIVIVNPSNSTPLNTDKSTVEKLAGILIELQGDMEGPSAAVIGIGINLNLSAHLKQQIDQPATDLNKAASETINPNHLLGNVLHSLAQVLTQFEQNGFASLRDEWVSYHAYHQQAVKMLHPNGNETLGVVNDVAEDGVLLVLTAQGLQRFSSGEISLRANG